MKDLRSMQYEMQIFEYEDHSEFRIYNIDGEIWFSLADVCDRVGLQPHKRSYADHASKLDEDEKRRVSPEFAKGMPGSEPGMYAGRYPVLLISESGLYTLVLRSDKPSAKRFRKWVTSEVLPSIRRTGRYGADATAFIRRYNENWDRVEQGYFSVISELVWWLWGRLSHVGHTMADRAPDGRELRPDVSVGRLFADYLREEHPEYAGCHKLYNHSTPEAEVEARQYPNEVLPIFRHFVDTVWIPSHSPNYFRTRDPNALPYLPALLPGSPKSVIRPRPASLPTLKAS